MKIRCESRKQDLFRSFRLRPLGSAFSCDACRALGACLPNQWIASTVAGVALFVAVVWGLGGVAVAADAGKSSATDSVKAVKRVAAVVVPAGPVKGTVLGEAWEVRRARISGGKLFLYADATKGTPALEIAGLTEAVHSNLGKVLLEKALSGDKAAQAKLAAIPAKPSLESARIAFDKEDGLLALTKAQIRRSGGQIYHCDAPLPLVIEFGKKADGRPTVSLYFRHDGIAGGADEKILLAGHIAAEVQ